MECDGLCCIGDDWAGSVRAGRDELLHSGGNSWSCHLASRSTAAAGASSWMLLAIAVRTDQAEGATSRLVKCLLTLVASRCKQISQQATIPSCLALVVQLSNWRGVVAAFDTHRRLS